MKATALLAALAFRAAAQNEPSVTLDGLDGAAVLDALARECYDAGLASAMASDSIMDCSAVIEERFLPGAPAGADRVVVTHRLRFTLLERVGVARIGAAAWTEIDELGNVVEQPASEQYLGRVQRVLTTVVARSGSREPPAWAGRYDSEQAWHLDAHLKAVAHCDASLSSMTAESVAADLERVGLRPLDDDTRDRCEQLYTHLFEWGLARGDVAPTVAEYTRYRAALPPERRTCGGLLALDAICAP